jgi:hypothetical protein
MILGPARNAIPNAIAGLDTGHDIGQSRHAPGAARFFTNQFFHYCTQKKAGPNWTGLDCATNNGSTQEPLC